MPPYSNLNVAPNSHLKMPLRRVENSNPENVQVVLGDQQLGAVVWLVKENATPIASTTCG